MPDDKESKENLIDLRIFIPLKCNLKARLWKSIGVWP